ncbi:MAG: hypothetical protein VXZ13_08705 [Pseudomonadota bacterium]|nr:hypothetical protein [Pseudomonadota bacterium]
MSYGLSVFSQNGTRVFGTDLRTQNQQYNTTVTINGNSTSSTFSCANANDSSKVSISVFSTDRLFPGMFTVNTSSTGFSVSNTTSSSKVATIIVFRTG